MYNMWFNMVAKSTVNPHTGIKKAEGKKLILNMISVRKIISCQDLKNHFVQNGNMNFSTFKRSLEELEKKDKAIEKRPDKDDKRAVNYLLPGTLLPDKMSPSRVDRFLLEECEQLVSEIISSGLLQPSSGEMGESEELTLKALPLDVQEKIRKGVETMGRETIVLNPDVLEQNRKRREARILLLRKCETLHESLRWLQRRRDVVIPGWWGSDYMMEHWDTLAVWEDKPGRRSGHLLTWLEYLLGAIDVLDRYAQVENKSHKSAKSAKSDIEVGTKKRSWGRPKTGNSPA